MKKTLITACVAVLLSTAAVLAEGSAPAVCRPGMSFTEAQTALKVMVDSKKVNKLQTFDTVAAADAFLADYNKTFNKTVPLGQADHVLAFVLLEGDNAGLWIFGYKDGCQIGMTHIAKAKMNPEAKYDVPSQFLTHGTWMLVI